jgi:pimeloyl-ACP methyl ester carboxylesterase
LTPPGKPKPTPEQIKFINGLLTKTQDTKALAAVVRSWPTMMITESQLKANKVPTLALIGELDPLKKGVDQLEGRLTNLQTVVIPGTDHMTAFSNQRFFEELKKFLAAHSKVKPTAKAGTFNRQ